MTEAVAVIEKPNTIPVVAPNASAIAGNVPQLCGDADDLTVDSPEMLDHAAALVRQLNARAKALEDKRFEFTRPLDELKAKFMSEFAPSINALRGAAFIVKQKALAYQTEQDRITRAARAAAEEAQRKERERIEAEARRLEQKGKPEQAAAKRDIAQAMPTVAVMPALAPTKGGITYRDKWRGKVDDLHKLVKTIAKRPEYLALLSVNQSELDRLAGVFKEKLALDGVTVDCEKIPVAPR
jgi:hypothetical protein